MRGLKALLAVPVLTAGLVVVMPVAQAGADSVTAVCTASSVSGSTITLRGPCTTTVPLEIPHGFTLDGAGNVITARDPGPAFSGAVVTNAAGATSMHVRNVTVRGAFAPGGCVASLAGVHFREAGGTVSGVAVENISHQSGCQSGAALQVDALQGAQVVTVTGSTFTGFQKTGVLARGQATMNVSASTIGPGAVILNIAQNSVQYGSSVTGGGGAGGVFTGNVVVGRGFNDPTASGTAILTVGASNLTISGNGISGNDTDVAIFPFNSSNVTIIDNVISGAEIDNGIYVLNSSNVRVEDNVVERTAPTTQPDLSGIGASGSPTTVVVCNTVRGWTPLLDGVTQPPCITTNANLPNGRVGSSYSAVLDAKSVDGAPIVTWSVAAGALPPGLTFAADGTITGDPTTEGTFTFTATVADLAGRTATRDFTIIVGPLPPPLPPPYPPGSAGSALTPLTPARIVDTRTGLGGATGPTQPQSTTTFAATGVGGVPAAGVTAVVLNVAADQPADAGFIQVFPTGNGTPGESSSLNVDHAGQTIANLVIVGVDASGRFSVFTQSSTHLVIDVFGYFTAVPEASSGRLVTIDPVRVLDTRSGEGRGGIPGPVPAQGTVAVSMAGAIPTDASAVVMTLTGDQATAPGYIQAIPTGGATALRSSSNLNLDSAGDTMANTVIIPLGADGTVTLFTQSGANLVVDVVAYFTGASEPSATTGLFIPIKPTRVADTRVGGIVPAGIVASGATLQVPFRASPPLAAVPPSAVAGNLTATDTTASGYVQLIPTGTSTRVGSTSTLNINGPNRIVAAANVLNGVTGSITVHNQSATHLVYDVTGLFL